MKNLKTLREGWIDIEQETVKLASGLTIQEKVRVFFDLYHTFFSRLEETEAVFGPQRHKHLAELQQRLERLAVWQQTQHGGR